jgi:MYXO-CTERM domain-containing protein
VLGVFALLFAPGRADAIQTPEHLRGRAQLELAPSLGFSAARQVGSRIELGKQQRSLAHQAVAAELGAGTIMQVDADTGVLALVLPRDIWVAGPVDVFARALVARHIDALAPGSSASDWLIVSDELSASGVRTIGFAQHHAGVPVIGGQLSLSFKAGRLMAVRSLALPHVQVPTRTLGVAAADAAVQARAWIAGDFTAQQLELTRVDGPVSAPMILPLVDPSGVLSYREVVSVEVSLAQPRGRWLVYLDAATGQPIARRSLLHWAQINFNTWRRGPLTERLDYPAAYLDVALDGVEQTTDVLGQLNVPGANTPYAFDIAGSYAFVLSDIGPELSFDGLASPMVALGFGSTIAEEEAQLNSYVHAQIVKDHIRGIDPGFEPINLPTQITVNIDDVCNAFADANTLNFFVAGGGCENTGLIADVIYHEYGHVAHTLGLQPGVGLFDGGVSEGASDFLSATITGDARLSPGFFQGSDEPLRDLDPPGYEYHWPEDTGEVHYEGQIIGGTLWDLRVALIEKHGEALGREKIDLIWLDGIRRSVDTPSWYYEALLTNDDDGNLGNGTPDICEINAAFAAHGLYQPLGSELTLSQVELDDGSLELTLDYGMPMDPCPGSLSPSAVLRWHPRDAPAQETEVAMAEVSAGLLRALIPPQPDATVTQYQVAFDWGNGSTALRPDNRADGWYEHYNGLVVPIWCSSFEGDDGWSADGEWQFGPPTGAGGDPAAAFDGNGVAGVVLNFVGTYTPLMQSSLRSPVIDTSGRTGVRLQYRRWLNVEDGFYDQAWIAANGVPVWQNLASLDEYTATVHHRDREWRFHDVELDEFIGQDGKLQLEFGQISDGGLEFGGWTVDSVCVVAPGVTDAICGDGYKHEYEQCDDGNLHNGDGCSSGCLFEEPPEPEEPPIDEDDWTPGGRGCGCTSAPQQGGGLGALGLLLLLGLRRRKRSMP